MCLDTISDQKPEDSGEGWQVFKRVEDKPDTFLPFICNDGPYKVGTEYTGIDAFGPDYTKYKVGFHICKTEQGARDILKFWTGSTELPEDGRFAIRKVNYRGAHLQGTQNSNSAYHAQNTVDIIVAAHRTILEEN